jgi:hypothetical protein
MNKSALATAGFGFAAGLVLFVVVEPLLLSEPKESLAPQLAAMVTRPTTTQATASPPSEPFPEARRAVTRTMKDPDSARFGALFQGRGMSGKLTVCGEVDAKNGIGGYTGMTPFIYFAETDQAMLIADPVTDRMTQEGITAFLKDCRNS